MRGRALVLVGLAGCSQVFGLDSPTRGDGGVARDDSAQRDDAGDDGGNCPAWTSTLIDTCLLPVSDEDLDIDDDVVIDTTTLTISTEANLPEGFELVTITQSSGIEAAVMVGRSISMTGNTNIRARGTRPLLIASWTTITVVNGAIDVSSQHATNLGAGANPALCGTSTGQAGADEVDTGGGSGGGGGGGFRGDGGMGGPGDTNGQNVGGSGGMSIASAPTLRGGCAGGASGMAGPDAQVANPTLRAAGGFGGGGVMLLARDLIDATNMIVSAGGGGGHATLVNQSNGGGGGGSGGLVAIHAPVVRLENGSLTANGGGGGTGAAFASMGNLGQNAFPSATAAAGGASSACANAGATGSAATTLNGDPASQTVQVCGGSGGGGGAGFVYVFATNPTLQNTVTSPPVELNPF